MKVRNPAEMTLFIELVLIIIKVEDSIFDKKSLGILSDLQK